MQVTTLLNPGQNPLAQTIRKEVARVISQLEIADVTGTPEPAFAQFLADAASKTPGSTTGVYVANGAAVNVTDQDNSPSIAATISVAGGVITGAKLTPTTSAIVQNTAGIPLADSAGVAYPSGCTAVVVGGSATQMRMVATARSVNNAVKIPVGTVSGSGTFGTFTVVNGVITGIVLSAS